MIKWIPSWLVILLALAVPSPGAILYLEDFDPDNASWVDRDSGEMTVTHNAGNYLQGSFGASILPMTDAFRADAGSSGGAFVGSYAGLTQIAFDLYAVNVLPSDLFIRIIDGANIFTYQFNNPVAVGNWETFTVNLTWSYGWVGSNETDFNNALASVDYIDIQITRNGSSAQSYYLDNVQTLNTDIGDPGGPTAVPEPGTLNLILLVGILLAATRRYMAKNSFAGA